MILKGFPVGPIQANCFIVGSDTTKEGMVVDPGDEADVIVQRAKELGLTVKLIVATHKHFDHIGAAAAVKEATGAEFLIHEEDAKDLSESMLRSSLMGLPMTPPPEPDRFLKGGDTVEVGDLSFIVLHTPGHTPGGICLVGHGVAFTGDTLFKQSIGRFDMPGGNGPQLLDSIHTKLMVLPDNTLVLPGHGPETTIGFERTRNPFLRKGVILNW